MTIIIVAIIIFVGIAVFQFVTGKGAGQSRSERVHERFFEKLTPPDLLIPAGHACEPLAERLLSALPTDYEHQLRQRVMSEHRLSESEWEWRWMEMKRYLIICSLFQEMPMFSAKVDDIWHEMLMFTREYSQFCDRFFGYMLHHSPHGKTVSQPNQRALFDWVYGELFPVEKANSFIWGGFYHYPLSEVTMNEMLSFNEFEKKTTSIFNRKTFKDVPEAREGILYLRSRFREQSQAALEGRKPEAAGINPSNTSGTTSDSYNYNKERDLNTASAAFVYYSYIPPADFNHSISPYLPDDVQDQHSYSRGGSASSCGTGYSVTDNTYGHQHSHHGHHHSHDGHDHSSSNGSDSSGSSCSSSSSCSSGSSCGGGGSD